MPIPMTTASRRSLFGRCLHPVPVDLAGYMRINCENICTRFYLLTH